jgi:hypothetical protein
LVTTRRHLLTSCQPEPRRCRLARELSRAGGRRRCDTDSLPHAAGHLRGGGARSVAVRLYVREELSERPLLDAAASRVLELNCESIG